MKRYFSLLFLILSTASQSFAMEQDGPWNASKEEEKNTKSLINSNNNNNNNASEAEKIALECSDGTIELSYEQICDFQTLVMHLEFNKHKGGKEEQGDNNTFDLSEYSKKVVKSLMTINQNIIHLKNINKNNLLSLLELADYLQAKRVVIRELAKKINTHNFANLDEIQKDLLNNSLKPITFKILKFQNPNFDLSDYIKNDAEDSSRKQLLLDGGIFSSLESLEGIEYFIAENNRNEINEIIIRDLPLMNLDCQMLTELFPNLDNIIMDNKYSLIVKMPSKDNISIDFCDTSIEEFKFPSNQDPIVGCKINIPSDISFKQQRALSKYLNTPALEKIRKKYNASWDTKVQASFENCSFLSGLCLFTTSFPTLWLDMVLILERHLFDNSNGHLISSYGHLTKLNSYLICGILLIHLSKKQYPAGYWIASKIKLPTNSNTINIKTEKTTFSWKDIFKKGL